VPKVFEINGYKFFFFSNEGIPLEQCHIHVRKNSALAKFWITDKAELSDTYGFSSAELSFLERTINVNIQKIREAWNAFFIG
jgi:hypothetical protein